MNFNDETDSILQALGPMEIDFINENIGAIKDFIDNVVVQIPVDQFIYKDKYNKFVKKYNDQGRHKFSSFNSIITKFFIFSGISENALISYWDMMCRFPIEEYLFLSGKMNASEPLKIDRNVKSHNTESSTTTNLFVKPDLIITYNGYLIMKGEEKAEGSNFSSACEELKNKDCDFYEDFILGYAAAGRYFQLFAITKKHELLPLSNKLDLSEDLNRLSLAAYSYNIARLICGQITKLIQLPCKIGSPFTILKKSEFATVENIGNNQISKIISKNNRSTGNINPNYDNSVLLWNFVYEQSKNHNRKIFLHCDYAKFTENNNKSKFKIIMKKYDSTRKPKNENELIDAIKQILATLKILHDNNFFHCDLRWVNILYSVDENKYFLADFDNGLYNGSKSKPIVTLHFTHYPRWLNVGDLYNTEADLYQVAQLVKNVDFFKESENLQALAEKILKSKTCEEALNCI